MKSRNESNDENGEVFTGGCMCGAVTYRVNIRPDRTAMCHCAECRRAVGAQSVAWVTVPVKNFWFIHGEPVRYKSSKRVQRTFCGKCGTSLTYTHSKRKKEIDITTASFDHAEELMPVKDVFCRDRLPWVEPSTPRHME